MFEEPNIEIYRCVKGDIDRRKSLFHFFMHSFLFVSLFVYLLFLVKHFYRFILNLNTFEDVIQTLAVEMYVITFLLHAQHAFSAAQFITLMQRLARTS